MEFNCSVLVKTPEIFSNHKNWIPSDKDLKRFKKMCLDKKNGCVHWIGKDSDNNIQKESYFKSKVSNKNKTIKKRKRFGMNGEQFYVNRLVHAWFKGEFLESSEDKLICKIDPDCVSPDHLIKRSSIIPKRIRKLKPKSTGNIKIEEIFKK